MKRVEKLWIRPIRRARARFSRRLCAHFERNIINLFYSLRSTYYFYSGSDVGTIYNMKKKVNSFPNRRIRKQTCIFLELIEFQQSPFRRKITILQCTGTAALEIYIFFLKKTLHNFSVYETVKKFFFFFSFGVLNLITIGTKI